MDISVRRTLPLFVRLLLLLRLCDFSNSQWICMGVRRVYSIVWQTEKKDEQKCAIRSWDMDVFYLAIFIIHSNKSFDWISSTCNSHMNAAALVCLFLIFFLGCPFSILLSREFSQWLTHICTHSNLRTHTHIHMYTFERVSIDFIGQNLPQQWFQRSMSNIFIIIEREPKRITHDTIECRQNI